MARNIRRVLQDILTAIQGIETATAGKTFADFQSEWLLRYGVQRGIEIISEASRHLPAALLASHPETAWEQVKGIGSVLRHEYHRISGTYGLSPSKSGRRCLRTMAHEPDWLRHRCRPKPLQSGASFGINGDSRRRPTVGEDAGVAQG
jgi:uncharacterized protein with HEPN domain